MNELDDIEELELLLADPQQEQDLNPPDDNGWNGVF